MHDALYTAATSYKQALHITTRHVTTFDRPEPRTKVAKAPPLPLRLYTSQGAFVERYQK